MQPFMNAVGGYLTNPNVTSTCEYCAYSTTDKFLADNFSIEYAHRWGDLGIVAGFVAFNVSLVFVFRYCGLLTR